jgi:hypothetical protein
LSISMYLIFQSNLLSISMYLIFQSRLESQIILKSLGARKAKGLNQDGQIHGNFIWILATAVVDIKLDF